MDDLDRAIINTLQGGLPVCERPYAEAGTALGLGEAELIARLAQLLKDGTLTRFGPLFDVERMGGAFSLCAMAVPQEDFERVAAVVNALAEVAHNYERDHALNMWFVLACREKADIARVLADIRARTGLPVWNFPREAEYFIELKLAA